MGKRHSSSTLREDKIQLGTLSSRSSRVLRGGGGFSPNIITVVDKLFLA